MPPRAAAWAANDDEATPDDDLAFLLGPVEESYCPTAAEMMEVLTTINGYEYLKQDACQLAYSIWVRFGRDDAAATQAWCKLLEDDTPVADFKRMVQAYLYTYLRRSQAENTAEGDSPAPTTAGEGG